MDTQALIVSLLSVLVALAAAYWAYEQGYADPLIEKLGIFWFKAKAEAEKKKLQAQGMKAGEDFVDSQLKGSQEANEVKQGLGGTGGLKKNL